MNGVVNMSGVQEQGTIAPQGIYDVEIAERRDGTSKNNDPMIAIRLAIASGEFQGKWVWDNIIISNDSDSPGYKILGRTKHFLHCIGEPYDGAIVKWNSDNWVGKVCKIRIDHEPPNEYHKFDKPIVAEYILDEELQQEEIPF